ncbi:MAG: sodium:glutamate symporter [Acholeplasmataceae bacterium]|nr:MAG: sodium:glutamate symporter [Acholeplasmataceae bacterium]
MTANTIGLSLLILGLALLVGKWIRVRFKIFSYFFLPSSIIAGFLMLLLGPEVLGKILSADETFAYGLFNADMFTVFQSLPGLLISVIFAGLFIGKKIPGLKDIWMTAGPQVSFGQSVAWGQYVFGLLVTMAVLVPVFNANPMVGALIEIAFEGGHGTSAGLAGTFEELGFSEGRDLAMGLATVGVLSGVIFGVILINWSVRKNHTVYLKKRDEMDVAETTGIVPKAERKPSSLMTVSTESIEPLALHFGVIALAIMIGIGILQSLVWLESVTWGRDGGFMIFRYIPLFPVAMLGGVIVQFMLQRFDKHELISRDMINRLQGLALDFLIVGAMASLSLTVIGEHLEVFVILALTGIVWNLFMFVVVARHMIPKYWFERGIGDMGQSMGMTAIGLMLIRIVDGKNKTGALEAFGYKQLLFEPFVGGGVMTAISVPLIFQFGPLPVMLFSLVVMTVWLLVGLLYFGRKRFDEIP